MESNLLCTDDSNIKYINLVDRGDRLGTNLIWYISTILIAVKNNYKIHLTKLKNEYRYYDSIFVKLLLYFIEDYNEKYFKNTMECENILIKENYDFFKKHINTIIDVKCDYVTAFKENIFTEKFKEHLNKLGKTANYIIPYNVQKTILVHLRLDDMSNCFVDYETRKNFSMNFRNIIDNDDNDYEFPGYKGQSAIKENEIVEIINRVLNIYKDYEVVIITNGRHNLPHRTIYSNDESYDLFLLCNSNILIGSMSTFSFSAILFGNHRTVYYPLWDHCVCFGLTTKYDKTKNIEFF